jgi:hypothetical protein
MLTTASAHIADDHRGWTPASQAGGGFVNYLRMLREAFSEGMQQANDARRKYPFADV